MDHNCILDMYPEYEYIFGPYNDCNEFEFNTVYLMYTNRINKPNEIKVLYANRVLSQYKAGCILPSEQWMLDQLAYTEGVGLLKPITNKLNNNCYYRYRPFTEEDKAALNKIYGNCSITQPRYNAIRENFVATLTMSNGERVAANPYRILCEIYQTGRRLTKEEIVSPLNGKKADLRPENVYLRNITEETNAMRTEALDVYGLDTVKLEKICSSFGYGRFRGIYTHDGIKVDPALKGRRYVKMVKDGTDLQFSLLLSRAIMTVAENRVLSTEEEVDHIDHNHYNDDITNLRIIGKRAHISEDSIRVEVDPVLCSVCGKSKSLSNKEFIYYKSSNSPITCCTQCKTKLRGMSENERGELALSKVINYRYYINDKITKQPLYFESKNYAECRQQLYTSGQPKLK